MTSDKTSGFIYIQGLGTYENLRAIVCKKVVNNAVVAQYAWRASGESDILVSELPETNDLCHEWMVWCQKYYTNDDTFIGVSTEDIHLLPRTWHTTNRKLVCLGEPNPEDLVNDPPIAYLERGLAQMGMLCPSYTESVVRRVDALHKLHQVYLENHG